jgi:hypothetical protein
MAHEFAQEIMPSSSTNESVSPELCVSLVIAGGHYAKCMAVIFPASLPVVRGGSPTAVFWCIQLPQTVQFHLLLTFVMLPGGPNALTPETARSPCGGTLDGFPTSSRQASQGCI